jgi:dimethylglycine dehydrogenase
MDVSRYGDWTSTAYTNAKVRENYSRRFQITFPNEELPAARPLRTTPIYERLKEKNAVFGVSYGLEHALWFAPEGQDPVEEVTFRRSNAFDPVADECRAVREGVGLLEISNFAKYEVKGPDAEGWLSRLLANRMPRQGRIILTPMLDPNGKLIGDFTVAKAGPERFYIFGSGVAEEYHLRWFESRLPASGVSLRSVTAELAGLSVAGPKSRQLLTRFTREDISNEAFKFMAFKETTLDRVPVKLGRITYTGDLGYEIWVRADYQRTLYDLLVNAGADLELKHFGGRALNSLRLEKSFGSWAREFRPIYGPFEAGLDRFVDLNKNDFIGRDGAIRERDQGPNRRLVTLVVDADVIDVIGDEPVWRDGEVVGWVTSGGYAHYVKKSVALAYVPAIHAGVTDADAFEVEILGDKRKATLAPEPLLDPEGKRMRG